LAPDPEDTQKANPHSKFQPHPKAPPGPDVSKFVKPFETPEQEANNVFYKATPQAIAVFRTLMGHPEVKGPLKGSELAIIRKTQAEARDDAKKYHIPAPVAASLRFAADQAHLDYDQMMQKMIETKGNVGNADPVSAAKEGPFKFGVSDWLYIMKTHGTEHGLDYFANKIKIENVNGRTTVEATDPAALREILALRDNPQISALMGAEFVKHQGEIPPVTYKGVNTKPDPQVAKDQANLLKLGFDLGIYGADGLNGPLSQAASAEFQKMNPLLPGQSLSQAIDDAAHQAEQDSAKYSVPGKHGRKVSPADAFAVRTAAKAVGMDYGTMMEIAQAETGFKGDGIKASTSSATGLFQFIDSTWLTELYQHGDKYGLGDITKQIEVKKDKAGNIVSADIHDPLVKQYALDLRADPRINSLMGAEYNKENQDIMQGRMPGHKLTRTDLYLAHFLSPGPAVDFLTQMKASPNQSAAATFPDQAAANYNVFHNKDGTDKTLKEVYDYFKSQFYTKTFDNASAPTDAPAKPAKPAAHPHAQQQQ
jgi:hypothetical protein